MHQCRWIPCGAILVVGIVLGTVGLAQTLPRLPEDYVFPQGDGSPGKVTFSHVSHIGQRRPDCTVCHPVLFKILQKGSPTHGAPIRHSSMEAGRACGACHDGKASFGLDNCDVCHRGQ